MKKQYFSETTKFDKFNFTKDYTKTLQDMLVSFSKSTLCKMFEIFDYANIMPFMTGDLAT